jgi:hypothetical protein
LATAFLWLWEEAPLRTESFSHRPTAPLGHHEFLELPEIFLPSLMTMVVSLP